MSSEAEKIYERTEQRKRQGMLKASTPERIRWLEKNEFRTQSTPMYRNMIKALEIHSWQNTVDDWQRYFEAKFILKLRRTKNQRRKKATRKNPYDMSGEGYGGPMLLKGYDPEMYAKGYQNAAIQFAYIPDFKSGREKKSFEAGLKAGYATRKKVPRKNRSVYKRKSRVKLQGIKKNPRTRTHYAKGPWHIIASKGIKDYVYLGKVVTKKMNAEDEIHYRFAPTESFYTSISGKSARYHIKDIYKFRGYPSAKKFADAILDTRSITKVTVINHKELGSCV